MANKKHLVIAVDEEIAGEVFEQVKNFVMDFYKEEQSRISLVEESDETGIEKGGDEK